MYGRTDRNHWGPGTWRNPQKLPSFEIKGETLDNYFDVIKNADWLIDLGPEGGDRGGEIVAEGAPRVVAKSKRSYTGQVLREAGVG